MAWIAALGVFLLAVFSPELRKILVFLVLLVAGAGALYYLSPSMGRIELPVAFATRTLAHGDNCSPENCAQ
jgi:hypothetical protein